VGFIFYASISVPSKNWKTGIAVIEFFLTYFSDERIKYIEINVSNPYFSITEYAI